MRLDELTAALALAGLVTLACGEGGDVVLYRVDYEWPLLVGLLAPVFGNDGKVPLSASVAVRNEPYSESTPTC